MSLARSRTRSLVHMHTCNLAMYAEDIYIKKYSLRAYFALFHQKEHINNLKSY
jgi:hypothetical protein